MSKNVKILFTISILANVLLAGALGGMIIDQRNDMPWEKVKAGLSPQAQAQVTTMFQSMWKDTSSVMRQSMDNRKYLADVVAAEEFDPAQFDEAVKRIRGVQDLITKKKIASTKELLTNLPKEDRQKLAEQVANSLSWKGGMHKKKMHNYPKPPGGDAVEAEKAD